MPFGVSGAPAEDEHTCQDRVDGQLLDVHVPADLGNVPAEGQQAGLHSTRCEPVSVLLVASRSAPAAPSMTNTVRALVCCDRSVSTPDNRRATPAAASSVVGSTAIFLMPGVHASPAIASPAAIEATGSAGGNNRSLIG